MNRLTYFALFCLTFAAACSDSDNSDSTSNTSNDTAKVGYQPPPAGVSIVNLLPKTAKASSEKMRQILMRDEWWEHPFPLLGKPCEVSIDHVDSMPSRSYTAQWKFDEQGRIVRHRALNKRMGSLTLYHYQDNRVVAYRRNLTPDGKLSNHKSRIVGRYADWIVSEFDGDEVWRWYVSEGDSEEERATTSSRERATHYKFVNNEVIEPNKSASMRLHRSYTDDGYLIEGLYPEHFEWKADRSSAKYKLGAPFKQLVIVERDAKGNPLKVEFQAKKNATATFTYNYCEPV